MKCKQFILFYLVLVITNQSCSPVKSSTFGYNKAEAKDTITRLEQTSTSKLVVLKAGNGKLYYAKNLSDSLESPLLSMADAAPPLGAADPVNENSGMAKAEAYGKKRKQRLPAEHIKK